MTRDGAGFAFRGRWAMVTGASSGIGEAFVHALAARGMNVVLCARSAERMDAVADAVRTAHGVRAEVVPADLARPGEPARAWAYAADGRDIHLLVNNVGVGLGAPFHDAPRARLREMVDLNCGAVLELAHLALGDMRPRGEGGIVNVASLVSFQPVPGKAAYAATKAFVLSLSAALAEENRDAGVRVVALCPGPVRTGFQAVAGTRVRAGQAGEMTADDVVRAALHALEGGRTAVVPGALNRAASLVGRLLPPGAAARLAARVEARTARTNEGSRSD